MTDSFIFSNSFTEKHLHLALAHHNKKHIPHMAKIIKTDYRAGSTHHNISCNSQIQTNKSYTLFIYMQALIYKLIRGTWESYGYLIFMTLFCNFLQCLFSFTGKTHGM